MMTKKIGLLIAMIGLVGCAHQAPFNTSAGHIGSEQDNQQKVAPSGEIPKPVKKLAYVPPPKPRAKEQTYSVVVSDVPLREVLFALARESKLNVDIHPDIKGSVTMNAVDQTLPAILDRLSKQVDFIYSVERDVISIKPDAPVLKTYLINYVNMDRDTKGSIGVSQEIASGGTVGGGGSSSGGNTSGTKVETISKNHFWDTLIQNIKDILAESDKEVLVRRLGTDERLQRQYDSNNSVEAKGTGAAGGAAGKVAGAGNETVQGKSAENETETKKKTQDEYKLLYAASIMANRETGVLSVRATQRQHDKVQEFVDRVLKSAGRQVLIEATIVEIALNDNYQTGIDWSRLNANGSLPGAKDAGFTFQQELLGTALTGAPRMVVGYSRSTVLGTLAASLRLLQTFGDAKVLSSPKMMVLNSQTAILKVVDNLVYFTITGTPATLSSTGTVVSPPSYTTTPHTLPVGVWMSVTPQINDNGAVILNVRPTISRAFGVGTLDPNPGLTIESRIPNVQVREMESMLQVNSGNTVVLGGLMQDEVDNTENSVPGVSSLPLVGNLFKAKKDTRKKTELVIFLRPTVIPNGSLESEELKSFKQYLPENQFPVASDEPAN